MIHIITGLLHKAVLLKATAVLLSIATVAVVFQLSSVFQVHALNVHTEIKADPPGLVRIIDSTGDAPAGIADTEDGSDMEPPEEPGTDEPDTPSGDNGDTQPTSSSDSTNIQSTPPGQDKKAPAGGGGGAAKPKVVNPKSNRPTILTINTPVLFGLKFPGETDWGEFTICITDPEIENDPTVVQYHITCTVTSDETEEWLDLTEYLTIALTPAESGEGDTTSFATLNWDPEDPNGDKCDTWRVTLNLPDDPPRGDYWSDITIHVDYPNH